MESEYNANIPRASRRLTVTREIRPWRVLLLKVKGFLDKRHNMTMVTEDGRCGTQFAERKRCKLDADIEALRRQLHCDTLEGVQRLAKIEANLTPLSSQINASEDSINKSEAAAVSAQHKGDIGVPESTVSKRRAKRKSKAGAAEKERLFANREKLKALLEEKAELEAIHDDRERIAADSRNQLCATFLIEMAIYMDAAGLEGVDPPDISQELSTPMIIANQKELL